MPTIYASPDGTIVQVRNDETPDVFPAPTPAEAPLVLDVDDETNPALAADLRTMPGRYRLAAPIAPATTPALRREGAPVVLAAAGRARTDRAQVDALLAKLDAEQALTAAELRVAVRLLLRAYVRGRRAA